MASPSHSGVFSPGILTFDAYYVYQDMQKHIYGDWQSPAMLALWRLIDPIAPGTGSILLLTAALYWSAFALIALVIARPSPWLGVVLPLLGFTPPAFMLLGVIWRDILFGVCWMLAAGLAFAVARRNWYWRRAHPAHRARAVRIWRPAQAECAGRGANSSRLSSVAGTISLARAALALSPRRARGCLRWCRSSTTASSRRERQHPLHSIMVFDLGGISHFAGENVFPGNWTPEQDKLIVSGCYKPIAWDIYWTQEPCLFVMGKLEGEKLFGTPAISSAWLRAVTRHPLAYLEHRFSVEWMFLGRQEPCAVDA